MSTIGLEVFDTTVQKTNQWVNQLADQLGWENKHRVFQALRVTLHTLRDRLPVGEATQLAAQLPVLLAGFYYEDWKPTQTPSKERSKEEFLSHIREYFQDIGMEVDAEKIAREVFKLLSDQIAEGEITDIIAILPEDIRQLWPQAAHA
ncbi:MAG: DUF2267 domain-containing protein [Halothece sp.]